MKSLSFADICLLLYLIPVIFLGSRDLAQMLADAMYRFLDKRKQRQRERKKQQYRGGCQ